MRRVAISAPAATDAVARRCRRCGDSEAAVAGAMLVFESGSVCVVVCVCGGGGECE